MTLLAGSLPFRNDSRLRSPPGGPTLKKIIVGVAAAAALLVVPSAALATNGSDGAGQAFGQHHAAMAQAGMLGQDMNPGMHQGFSGWTPM